MANFLAAAEAQGRIVDGCLQLFGGYGYMEVYRVSTGIYRCQSSAYLWGTSEIMKEIISKDLLGKKRN